MKRLTASGDRPAGDTFWRTLTTFSLTRVLIILLLLVYLWLNSRREVGGTEQVLFMEAYVGYLLLAIGFAGVALYSRQRLLVQLTVQVLSDITVISILFVGAGGGRSGLAILYLFPLAGSAILAPLVLALFFASAVALFLLIESGVALLASSGDTSISQAGLYGASFLVAVFAINRLAARLIKQEQLAAERGKALQLQEAINRLVIADMGDGILVVGRDGTVTTANPAAEKMLGLSIPYAAPFLRLPDHATLAPIAEAFAEWVTRPDDGPSDASAQVSIFVQVKPGDGLPVAGTGGSAVSSASGTGTAPARAVRRDLTAHLKLRFARVDAQGLSQDRTVIFMQDVSEIENQAQQLKLASMGRLTASIAHEVRNPLSAISYSASLLMEEMPEPGNARLLSIVADNVARLNRMIEDILQLSRKVHRPETPLVLAPIIDTILAEFRETHAVPPGLIQLSPVGGHRVWFDAMHLQEVLVNLLSNALRYASGRDGSIRIDIVQASATRLELHVQDDGDPISPEVRAHLFEPFYTTSSKGTGLGLYMARELCLNNDAVLDYEYRFDADLSGEFSTMEAVDDPRGRFVITLATADPA